MPDRKSPLKAADAIAEHLEKLILEGVLRPGEKLAAERDLAERLDVSRPTLRDAISKLAARGLLETGRSGTFVAQYLAPLMEPLAALLAGKPQVTDDYFEFRRFVEVEAAGLAAARATDLDREAISLCRKRMVTAHEVEDPTQEGQADIDLHLLVYEASHNLVLLHIMRSLVELMRRDVIYNRKQLYARSGVRDLLFNQHLEIADCIIAGDREGARTAAAEHIRFTLETIEEIRRTSERMAASLNRVGRGDLLSKT